MEHVLTSLLLPLARSSPVHSRGVMDVRIAVVPHRVVAERDGAYYCTPELAVFLEETAAWCEAVAVYVPLTGDKRRAARPLPKSVSVTPLPDRLPGRAPGVGGAASTVADWVGQFSVLLRGIHAQDAVYVFQPSVYGCLAAVAASLLRRQYAVYLAGNIEGTAGGSRWARLGILHRAFTTTFSLGLAAVLRQAQFIIAPGRFLSGDSCGATSRLFALRLGLCSQSPRCI